MMGEGMNLFAQAKASEPANNTNIALIGQVTNALENANKAAAAWDPDAEDVGPLNPMRPRSD